MNKLIITIILTISFVAAKATPADSLVAANELYATGEYQKAISVYENIVEQGYGSGTLYYNLGNAYYKNNEVTKAILNYERAKLFEPYNDDILFNLQLANQFVVDKIEPLPQPFFVKWGQAIVNVFNADQWAAISVACFILMLVLASLYVFSRRYGLKKLSFLFAVILLVVSLTSFVFAGKQKSKIDNRSHAIIFMPTVTVKASPAANGTDLFVIHEGLKVEIINSQNNWHEIKLEDGNIGWVKEEVLEKI